MTLCLLFAHFDSACCTQSYHKKKDQKNVKGHIWPPSHPYSLHRKKDRIGKDKKLLKPNSFPLTLLGKKKKKKTSWKISGWLNIHSQNKLCHLVRGLKSGRDPQSQLFIHQKQACLKLSQERSKDTEAEPRIRCKTFISGFLPFQDSLIMLVSSVEYFGKEDAHRAWNLNYVGSSQEPLYVAPWILLWFILSSAPTPVSGMSSGSCWGLHS